MNYNCRMNPDSIRTNDAKSIPIYIEIYKQDAIEHDYKFSIFDPNTKSIDRLSDN